MPPVEAILAAGAALALGWWGGRRLHCVATRLREMRNDPAASSGRRRGATAILAGIFVAVLIVGSYLQHESDETRERLECEEHYGSLC